MRRDLWTCRLRIRGAFPSPCLGAFRPFLHLSVRMACTDVCVGWSFLQELSRSDWSFCVCFLYPVGRGFRPRFYTLAEIVDIPYRERILLLEWLVGRTLYSQRGACSSRLNNCCATLTHPNAHVTDLRVCLSLWLCPTVFSVGIGMPHSSTSDLALLCRVPTLRYTTAAYRQVYHRYHRSSVACDCNDDVWHCTAVAESTGEPYGGACDAWGS